MEQFVNFGIPDGLLRSVLMTSHVDGRDFRPGQMKVVVFKSIVSNFGADRHRCDEHRAVGN